VDKKTTGESKFANLNSSLQYFLAMCRENWLYFCSVLFSRQWISAIP